MARRSLNRRSSHVNTRLDFGPRIIRPVSSVPKLRAAFNILKQRNVDFSHQALVAPKRFARQVRKEYLRSVVTPVEYKKIHNCKREWSRLLSWRSAQGNGQRKRSERELQKSRLNFKRRDC